MSFLTSSVHLLQDDNEGIKSQSLDLILKLCAVEPGESFLLSLTDALLPHRCPHIFTSARAHLDDFISHFYENHIAALASYIGSFTLEEEAAKEASLRFSRATTFSYVVEALSDFVKYHSFRLKSSIMQHKIMLRVSGLCLHPQKFVVLSAVRFIKTCIFRFIRLALPHFTIFMHYFTAMTSFTRPMRSSLT
jgi:hypothetical protein